jgi:hypothetical protein
MGAKQLKALGWVIINGKFIVHITLGKAIHKNFDWQFIYLNN